MLSRNAHSRTMFISFVGRTPVAIPPEPLPWSVFYFEHLLEISNISRNVQ
jgi:hypothetical protein